MDIHWRPLLTYATHNAFEHAMIRCRGGPRLNSTGARRACLSGGHCGYGLSTCASAVDGVRTPALLRAAMLVHARMNGLHGLVERALQEGLVIGFAMEVVHRARTVLPAARADVGQAPLQQ